MAKAKVVRKKKVVEAPPSLFHAGIVMNVCCAGFHLLPETAQRLGYRSGNYLTVTDAARCTSVTRELVSCNRGCPGMRKDYIYMDPETAHYLDTEVHNEVSVALSPYEMDFP